MIPSVLIPCVKNGRRMEIEGKYLDTFGFGAIDVFSFWSSIIDVLVHFK